MNNFFSLKCLPFAGNIALGKLAYQSSTLQHSIRRTALNAVDGVLQGRNKGSETTQQDTQPWWAVDLGERKMIGRVSVYSEDKQSKWKGTQ